eukprot:m51a1_g10663 hypothetical protein (395) ;mRNA; r:3024-4873
MVRKYTLERATSRRACNAVMLVVLFAQARILNFPLIWCLRRVCHAWRSAIESYGVLSSHVAQRERISRLQGVAVSREGLRDILLVDHIVDRVMSAEAKGFKTSNLRQSVRINHMLDTLQRLSLPAAAAACSVLGAVSVTATPSTFPWSFLSALPAQVALASLAIASAAAELSSSVHVGPEAWFQIVIAPIEKPAPEWNECLTDSFFVISPEISFKKARSALLRAIKVFTRVHQMEDILQKKGAELVTAATGVRLLRDSSKWSYYPLEQHLWVGLLLFHEDIPELARVFDFLTIWILRLACHSWRNAIQSTGSLHEQRRWGERLVTAVTGAIPSRYMYPSPREDHLWVGMLLFPEHTRQLSGMHVDGNGAKHGVDPKKGCVMVPWNYFDKYLNKF